MTTNQKIWCFISIILTLLSFGCTRLNNPTTWQAAQVMADGYSDAAQQRANNLRRTHTDCYRIGNDISCDTY